jgi:hypothetical protein
MIHIVFQHADTELLSKAMELDQNLNGEIVEIRDEWGVGPIADLDSEEGWNRLSFSPYEKVAGDFDDRETVKGLIHKLEEDPSLEAWIWMGQNQHDVTGYYWLMPQLRAFQGRIMVIYLNNLPFINEKGQLFYPTTVHDILPREVVKAQKLARPVTLSEYEVDPDEWKKISQENAMVRTLEGGKKITGQDESFYDAEILKNLTTEWQKAWRVLSNTLHRMKIKTGDVYLMWRMRKLIDEGRIQVLGEVNKGWKEFDLKLPGAIEKETSSEEQVTGAE